MKSKKNPSLGAGKVCLGDFSMRRLIGQRKKPFAYSGKNTQQKATKKAFESRLCSILP